MYAFLQFDYKNCPYSMRKLILFAVNGNQLLHKIVLDD